MVTSPIDFNPSRVPIEQEEEEIKNYYCLLCLTKPMMLTASIPQNYYVVGQKIPIKVSINNASNVDIRQVEFTLVKHVTYTSETPCINQKCGELEIQRMCHGRFFNRFKKQYNVEMEIPQTVPSTNSPLVKVVNVKYTLNIKAKVRLSSCLL